jgi:hypothetical protein
MSKKRPKKDIYVLFKKGVIPRIFVNPAETDKIKKMGKVVKNPDLSKLTGIPPHFWKLQGDRIVAAKEVYGANLSKERKVNFREKKEEKVESKKPVEKEEEGELKVIEIKQRYGILEPRLPWHKICMISAAIGSFSVFATIAGILAYLGAQ